MSEIYVEQDCTIEHEGQKFISGGAFVSPDYVIGYLKFPDGEYYCAAGEVTTWHGERLGSAMITHKWKVNSYIGNHMMQVLCRINGIFYTGRSFGDGMIWRGKRCKRQNV